MSQPDPDPSPGPAARGVSPRRRQLLDAALHVVADEGLRGLTHRAVDRRAGLPEGTCSAYLRTRRALQLALAEHVAGSLAADVAQLADRLRDCPGDHVRALEATRSLFLRWLDERELLLAKLALSLEAARDPELASLLVDSRTGLVAVVAGVMDAPTTAAAQERAEALVASFDGILVAGLLKPAAERDGFVSRAVAQLLGALAGGGPTMAADDRT